MVNYYNLPVVNAIGLRPPSSQYSDGSQREHMIRWIVHNENSMNARIQTILMTNSKRLFFAERGNELINDASSLKGGNGLRTPGEGPDFSNGAAYFCPEGHSCVG